MSYLTWHFVTPSPPWGGCFGTCCCRDLCSCDRHCWEDICVIADDCWTLVLGIVQWTYMGASILWNQYITLLRTDYIRQLSRPHTSRWRFLLLWRRSTVVLWQPRSSSWPSRSSSCHGVASRSFVSTFAVRWPPLLPPFCRRADSDRPPRPRPHRRSSSVV